jgi:hypothetical protein
VVSGRAMSPLIQLCMLAVGKMAVNQEYIDVSCGATFRKCQSDVPEAPPPRYTIWIWLDVERVRGMIR